MTARFAPVDLTADISSLPANERQALAKLIQAAKVFDSLFLRQVWSGNEPSLLTLVRDTSDLGRARLHYFLINKGPWSRLDHNEPFVPGAPPKPPQGSFYPPDSTKSEIESWIGYAACGRARTRHGLLHDYSARAGRPLDGRAVQHRVPAGARAGRGAAARSRGADNAANAEAVPRRPRARRC